MVQKFETCKNPTLPGVEIQVESNGGSVKSATFSVDGKLILKIDGQYSPIQIWELAKPKKVTRHVVVLVEKPEVVLAGPFEHEFEAIDARRELPLNLQEVTGTRPVEVEETDAA